MKTTGKKILNLLVCCTMMVMGFITNLYGQKKQKENLSLSDKVNTIKTAIAEDTTTVLPYHKVITAKAIIHKGLLTVDKVGKKWFLEVPSNILGKDILIVNRISKAAGDNKPEYRKNGSFVGYAGDEIGNKIVRFERHGSDIQLREVSFAIYGLKPEDPMYENVHRSDVQAIILTLPIMAIAPDSARVVEITSTLQDDNELFTFNASVKSAMRLGAFDNMNSYIINIGAYPQNISFKTLKTYKKGMAGGAVATNGNVTYELNSSWILLPSNQMKTRELDRRIGYYANEYTDFGKDPQTVNATSLITRWRMEPKPEDREKYLTGQLVEPAKPIVIYIDPTTPEKWVPYLIKGVTDWQKAFEKAGFKNAISARRAPTAKEDSTWSIDDVRYSTLVYMPSMIPNAMGPHISDPRTGEILETHINWYHNVMSVLHTWYMIQCGATDPRARKAEFDDELMGELIRFVSSHEVGHALGLRHNFAASNATPVEKLRDKAWVEEHGHTTSIMDYARFNYVAQPEDHIGPAGLYPRIGDYDKWAIEWGYKWFGDDSIKNEKTKLEAMVLANKGNPRLQFGAGSEEGLNDPRAQAEDLGDDDMKANAYGMKNLQYVAKNMTAWMAKKDGSNYDDLSKGYNGLVSEYFQFLLHATTYIGGIYVDNKFANQTDHNFAPVQAAKQKEALAFIDRFFFHEPSWIMKNDITGRLVNPQSDPFQKQAEFMISQMYDSNRLLRLNNSSARYGSASYHPLSYLRDLQDRIWSELSSSQYISAYRMELQNAQLSAIDGIINPTKKGNSLGGLLSSLFAADLAKTEIAPISRMLLTSLDGKIGSYLKNSKTKNLLILAHLKGARATIKKILDDKA